jgi:D-lyxose ketol-isomerase
MVKLTRAQYEEAIGWAWEFVQKAGVPLRAQDRERIDVAGLGLGELEQSGLQILTLVSDPWVAVKLLILRPNQFVPQHRHPPAPEEGYPGKTEVCRGQYGEAYLFVPGAATAQPRVSPPEHRRRYCTVWHEVSLLPGDQYVCPPNTWHWFQAGSSGAVIWSISSKATDAQDDFADPQVVRLAPIEP